MGLGEVTTPVFLQELNIVGDFALAVTAIAALIVLIAKFAIWLDRRKDDLFARKVRDIMTPIIVEATKPISERNGGHSLIDLHDKIDLNKTLNDARLDAIEAVLGIRDRRSNDRESHFEVVEVRGEGYS